MSQRVKFFRASEKAVVQMVSLNSMGGGPTVEPSFDYLGTIRAGDCFKAGDARVKKERINIIDVVRRK